jgi:hypothetical protein
LLDPLLLKQKVAAMMAERRIERPAPLYELLLDGHLHQNHLLRAINRFVDLDGVRAHLAPFTARSADLRSIQSK